MSIVPTFINNKQRIGFKSFNPEDGGSMALQNVGILPQHNTASQLREPKLGSSLL
jgi:hypothetical protein